MSPEGINSQYSAYVWFVQSNGDFKNYGDVDGWSYLLRPVINIIPDATSIGSGTNLDPFIVQ